MRSGLLSGVSRPVLVWALVVLSACAPGTGQPTPSVTSSSSPTYVCTPGVSGGPATPFPCEKERYDEQQKRAALEAEAISVYRRYWAEYVRLMMSGGADEPTPTLSETLTGETLDNIMAVLRLIKQGKYAFAGTTPSVQLKPAEAPSSPSEITLVACEDTRGSSMTNAENQSLGNGQLVVRTRKLKVFGNHLKIYTGESQVSQSCPI